MTYGMNQSSVSAAGIHKSIFQTRCSDGSVVHPADARDARDSYGNDEGGGDGGGKAGKAGKAGKLQYMSFSDEA